MITIADLKEILEQFDDDTMVVFRAGTKRELYDDPYLADVRARLDFEPVSLQLVPDVDYREPYDGESDYIRMKALAWRASR